MALQILSGKAPVKFMVLQILSGKAPIQFIPLQKLSGKIHFLVLFYTSNLNGTYGFFVIVFGLFCYVLIRFGIFDLPYLHPFKLICFYFMVFS